MGNWERTETKNMCRGCVIFGPESSVDTRRKREGNFPTDPFHNLTALRSEDRIGELNFVQELCVQVPLS